MDDVSIKAKCNADIRCQHQTGCGCLARGQTCDKTPLPEGVTESGEAASEEASEEEDIHRKRAASSSHKKEASSTSHRSSPRLTTPDGERVEVVDSEGKSANDEPVDDIDPLGIIKALNAKISQKKGTTGHGDTQDGGDANADSDAGNDDTPRKHKLTMQHSVDADTDATDGDDSAATDTDGSDNTEARSEGGSDQTMASVADVEKVLEGGQQYLASQQRGVREGLRKAASKPAGHEEGAKKTKGMFDLSHLF
jgi:hypothetical protein